MAAASSVINVAILGDSKKFRNAVGKAESKLKTFTKAAGLAFAGAAIAAGKMAIDVAGDIETMRNNLIAGTGASGEALDGLIDSARNVARDVPDSFDDVSRALADVNTTFGTTGAELETQTDLFLDFARVAGTDVSEAIAVAGSALTVFGETDADEALGDLLRVAQATGRPLEQLAKSVETFGPIFANMGFSLEETTALMGGLERAGVDVSRIGPALNKFGRDVAAAGEDPRKALEETVAAIQNATSDTEALNLATAAFGAEGAQRLSSAIRSGNFDLQNFGGLIGDGTGLVADQADGMLTLSDRFSVLTNRLKVGLMPAIESVLGVIEQLVTAFSENGLSGVLDVLREKFAPIEDWMKRNKPIVAALAVVIGGVLVAAVYSLVAAFVALLSPFVLVTAAVAAITAGVIYAYQNFETFRTVVDFVVGAVVAHFTLMKDLVTVAIGLVVDVVTGLADMFIELGEDAAAVGEAVADVAVDIYDKWNEYSDKVLEIFGVFFDPLLAAAREVFDLIAGAWNSTVGGFGFTVPGWVPGLSGKSFTIPNIPELADGGIVTGPTLALIGEAGAEAVIPLDRAGGIGGGMNVTVNMPAGSDGADVVAALQRYARAHGGTVPILTGQL